MSRDVPELDRRIDLLDYYSTSRGRPFASAVPRSSGTGRSRPRTRCRLQDRPLAISTPVQADSGMPGPALNGLARGEGLPLTRARSARRFRMAGAGHRRGRQRSIAPGAGPAQVY